MLAADVPPTDATWGDLLRVPREGEFDRIGDLLATTAAVAAGERPYQSQEDKDKERGGLSAQAGETPPAWVLTAVLRESLERGDAAAALAVVAGRRAARDASFMEAAEALLPEAVADLHSRGLHTQALALAVESLERDLTLDPKVRDAVLVDAFRGGSYAGVLRAVRLMRERGLRMEPTPYKRLIKVCSNRQLKDTALRLVGGMAVATGREPDRQALSWALCACGKSRDYESVMELLARMQRAGIEPTQDGLFQVARAREALGL